MLAECLIAKLIQRGAQDAVLVGQQADEAEMEQPRDELAARKVSRGSEEYDDVRIRAGQPPGPALGDVGGAGGHVSRPGARDTRRPARPGGAGGRGHRGGGKVGA